MNNALLTKFMNKNKRAGAHPEFRPGDTIRVHVKIKEGDKERLQAFEGTVIARNNTGMGETITVRKVSFGQGVERIFPVHAPVVDHIDVVRTGRVRRAKLVLSARAEGQGRASARARLSSPVPNAHQPLRARRPKRRIPDHRRSGRSRARRAVRSGVRGRGGARSRPAHSRSGR